jgi:hypothetical protein
MATELFITENQQALEQSELFFPRAVISRSEISKIKPENFIDVILDGADVEFLDQFVNAKKWYLPKGLDFNANLDIMNKSFVDGRLAYETPAPKQPSKEDDYLSGDDLSKISLSPDQKLDDNFDQEVEDEYSMLEQIETLQPLLENKKIGEGTVAELSMKVLEICKTNKLFERDIITGLFRTVFSKKPLISAERAEMLFNLHFCDRLAIKTTSYKTDKTTGETIKNINYRTIKNTELKLMWQAISTYSTFNSRKEFYDNIPEWDGEERIKTFMKKYFECDTNPNFFLLLMTCLVAKFSPRNDYCPYFFDIVAKTKGIGKSLLCRRLLGGKYCGFLNFAVGRRDDFFVNAYDGNNAIVVDDECTWVSNSKTNGKITTDEMKTLVSTPVDKFSRKMQQPEEHDRSFIIMRTSNDVNQVYATNERRQIIFECYLKEQECRILDLPDEFFQQMLAEAKDYYRKHHGVYQLTDNDKLEVKTANLDNYNWETKENFAILGYVKAVRAEPDKWGALPSAQKFRGWNWGSYQKYTEWCDANHKPCLQSRAFWRSVEALAELPEHKITVIAATKYEIEGGGKCRVFRIDPVGLTKEEKELADLEDLPL